MFIEYTSPSAGYKLTTIPTMYTYYIYIVSKTKKKKKTGKEKENNNTGNHDFNIFYGYLFIIWSSYFAMIEIINESQRTGSHQI